MFMISRANTLFRLAAAAAVLGATLWLTACASAPKPPTVALSEAALAIQTAEREDTKRHAAAELDRARQSLVKADKAVRAQDMVLAERLADEATVTAKLASARTEAVKAAAINDEIRRGTEAMLEEIRRAGDRS